MTCPSAPGAARRPGDERTRAGFTRSNRHMNKYMPVVTTEAPHSAGDVLDAKQI